MRIDGFKGGEGLKTKLQEILDKVKGTQTVKVGFFEGATYEDGTPVPMVAALQEYGTSTIPSRPFFRNMIDEKSPTWGKSLAAITKSNGYDMQKSMATMGEGIGSQLQQSIVNFNSVPLAESTIAAKGFDSQLIDTATMINSVGYQVSGGDIVKLPQKYSAAKTKNGVKIKREKAAK